jgi:hypothetical protein
VCEDGSAVRGVPSCDEAGVGELSGCGCHSVHLRGLCDMCVGRTCL